MNRARRVFLLLALGVASLLLAAGFSTISLFSQVMLFLGFGCFFAAAGVFFFDLLQAGRDPYDLKALKKFHDEDELRQVELPDANELEQVVCPHCGWVYSSKLPVCPECRTSPHR